MKIKFVIMFACVSVLFFSAFKSMDSKGTNPTDPVLDFIKSEYISSSHSEKLKTVMKEDFSDLFDEVYQIDIHLNKQNVYYYAVYGLKDNKKTIELFKTSKENVEKEFFPSFKINQTNVSGDPYCYWQIEQERCGYEPDYISIRCGLVSKGCQSF
ncbi:hypothetical protein [Confluentibacter sediminis]|uniref:hypothetical protein n=1 Tax=Confluentibacter sediminis TaxID=2219045 RepID=UPI0013A6918D|nr:hypothetical protein [Confluentibacter sediminis]